MPTYKYAISGSMNSTITETPPAGTHKYRVVARITTNAPSAGVAMSFTGKIDMVAQ